jgi:hypothetical protein
MRVIEPSLDFSLYSSLTAAAAAAAGRWCCTISSSITHSDENFVRPISCVVLTSNDRRKGAISTFWLIFIFCRFTSSSFPFFNFILYLFFSSFFSFFGCCKTCRSDRLQRKPWRHQL